jgi:hypothetical protein
MKSKHVRLNRFHLFPTSPVVSQFVVLQFVALQFAMLRLVILGFVMLIATGESLAEVPGIDNDRMKTFGIRKVESKHLVLYTDIPPAASIDELPAVFDQAVPQWCQYFQLAPEKAAKWKMVAYLINDKERFRRAGAMPADLPSFLNGYARDQEIWVYEQPSDYYRRHLLLHEGTHAYMVWRYKSVGPPWYMEGTAEYFGTHLWQNNKLRLGYFPANKEQTSDWGRVRIIKDEVEAGRAMSLVGIMKYDSRAHLRNEPYAWCWAISSFFQSHPKTQKHFEQLRDECELDNNEFNKKFYDKLKADWEDLEEQWQLFFSNMEYGYDLQRELIVRKEAKVPTSTGTSATIAAGRGWQSTGIRLEAGVAYDIQAAGRYQIATEPKIWWCEPGGVTIDYYRGRPVGQLSGAIRDEEVRLKGVTPLARPQTIGLNRIIRPRSAGTLYVRINESAAALQDNSGELTVRVVTQ